jgi:hypothetical protein
MMMKKSRQDRLYGAVSAIDNHQFHFPASKVYQGR